MSDDKIKPFSVISKKEEPKKNDLPAKLSYKILHTDDSMSEATCDFIDPNYAGLLMFGDYLSDTEAKVHKIVGTATVKLIWLEEE